MFCKTLKRSTEYSSINSRVLPWKEDIKLLSKGNISDANKEILIKKLTGNLKQLRAKLDITQEQLANIIGVSRQTINAIESGRREMNWMMFVITVLFFLKNEETRPLLTFLGIYTPELAEYLEIDSDNSKG